MAKYRLSKEAREDLIRIHQYGGQRFGIDQADAYFYSFLTSLPNTLIPFSQSTMSNHDIEGVFVVLKVFILESGKKPWKLWLLSEGKTSIKGFNLLTSTLLNTRYAIPQGKPQHQS